MRLVFFFSRSWIPYSETFRLLLPVCWPGATAPFLSKKEASLANKAVPSLLLSLLFGPVYLAIISCWYASLLVHCSWIFVFLRTMNHELKTPTYTLLFFLALGPL